MEWYYIEHNQQVGPVTDSALEGLIRSGKITSEALVWRSGMAGWEPYGKISGQNQKLSVAFRKERCVECGKEFPEPDMVHYQNAWVCATCKPLFFQRVKEGGGIMGSMVWRWGRILVMGRNALLPNHCIKCNEPVTSKLKRNIYWHSPFLYLLILISILVYAIVALIVRRRARIEVGICDKHLSQRRWVITISWLIFVGSIVSFIVGLAYDHPLLLLLSLFLFLGSIIFGAAKGRAVVVGRIDKEYIWLKGVRRQYLEALPECPQEIASRKM